jgi:hypothetical protein
MAGNLRLNLSIVLNWFSELTRLPRLLLLLPRQTHAVLDQYQAAHVPCGVDLELNQGR